ncbi:MAG: heavy metal translocating P-type ATPase [Burkholderiales bacterium]|jgi:heavy metal translocating P-type ATPase|nr:heavy metal translocating P-type ATPase [Burkholderiales bacterium]
MSSNRWFFRLEVVHQTQGRVRFKYVLRRGTKLDGRIIRAIELLMGVRSLRINEKTKSLIIVYDPKQTGADHLAQQILTLTPRNTSAISNYQNRAADTSARALAVSLMALLLSGQLPQNIKLPVSVFAALPLYGKALDDLREKGIGSHVLEAMAFSISLARQDYPAANTTIFMLSLGEYLEAGIARRSDELLKHLLRPVENKVWVMRDGEEITVPAEDVLVGDTVIVGAGAIVPVDGTVLSGDAMVNEAAMTGEATPVRKTRGKRALSGTVVEEGRMLIYAEKVGAKTAVARIADYVEHSLTAKSNTQIKATRLADKLVPAVLGLAGASWLISGDWRRAAAVLQADYSCALKLATPVAFKSAMYGAGQQNILVKGADALERLAEADTFIFDKTGTLTKGDLEVIESVTFDDAYSPEELIFLAASVEEHYFHPLAAAVVAAAHARQGHHFAHSEVEFVVAHGVTSVINGKRIVVGSRHFLEQHEHIDTTPYAKEIERVYHEGKILLFVGYGGHLLGMLALKDCVRDESRVTIDKLRKMGVKQILMLTGDYHTRAAELADTLGLDGFHAELLPEDKAKIVQSLKKQGAKIAFVGDGINDTPALADAHVGIAMQRGADVARLTADIVLLEDNIQSIAAAKNIANATMARINANYKLTIGLNSTILSAAALGLFTPMATTILHNSSTIAILLNAFRHNSAFQKSSTRC